MGENVKAFTTGFQIEGKVCVVTGGSSGIGLEYCKTFIQQNARVVCIIARDQNKINLRIEELKRELNFNTIYGYKADVSNRNEVEAVIDRIITEHNTIDLFAANAGVYQRNQGLDNWSSTQFNLTFNTNTMQILYAVNKLLPIFKTKGSGCFVISSSAAALFPILDDLNYLVSKSAALTIAEYLAVQHARDGIRTVCVCTSGVDTPLNMVDGRVRLNPELNPMELHASDVAAAVADAVIAGKFMVALPKERWQNGLAVKGRNYDEGVRDCIKKN
eukprot:snap_masked-scaffold_2-processed-gene-1.44-mRNA-1 protein AED:1.00 eAED:1.00 QI:0/-1/0/0/-1/1/1/0/273